MKKAVSFFLRIRLEYKMLFAFLLLNIFILTTSTSHYEEINISALSRLFNGFFAAILTSTAMIISLTSNLYSPKLIKVLLRNKTIIFALGMILLGNFLVIVSDFTPHNHWIYKYVFSMSLAIGVMLILFIGFALYNLAMLMKPSYFLPRMEEHFYSELNLIKRGNFSDNKLTSCFSTIEVMINIAKMSTKREDVKVVYQVIEICHKILLNLIEDKALDDGNWRKKNVFFVRGLSEEAKLYLEKSERWPEAYLFFCLRNLFDVPEANKNEIIALYSTLLLESLEASIDTNDDLLIEMHIMAYNSLLDENILLKREKNISTIGHSFSMGLQLLLSDKKNMRFAFKSYFHRFNKTHKLGMYSASIYLMSDMSKSLIMMANEDEEFAIEIYELFFKKQWTLAFETAELKDEMQELVVRLYWELKARKNNLISEKVLKDFSSDDFDLMKLTEEVIKHSRVLCYELNDRLIGHTFISKKGKKAISDYLNQ